MKKKRLSPYAVDIMINRYALRDDKNRPVESPAEIFLRTARVIAESENNYRNGLSVLEVKEKFFELMYSWRFVPNGRTLANAGTKLGQLANCFVLPVEDDLGRGTDSIFSVLRKAILILQTGGGVGFNFGHIRPKGAKIASSKGKATGAVSFVKVYDTAFWVIGQGGGRRSAAMAVLPVWHPDIYEFVSSKSKEGVIENFNISVGITDEFMEAVKKDQKFHLRHPENGETWKKVRAKDLFEAIVLNAYKTGEPGVLFLDRAEKENPVPHLYKLEATNPCGEQFLGPYENCCLGSVNLAEHVKKIQNSNPKAQARPTMGPAARLWEDPLRGCKMQSCYKVDWNKLAETVRDAVRFLDNVIDANKYVPAVPELEEAAKKIRRIGLSIMGLADMMYLVGVRYGSKEAQDLAGQVMEFIRYQAMKESIELARHRGAFPAIKGSIYDPDNLQWRQPKPLVKPKNDFGRPKLNWKKLKQDLRKYGIRNAAQLTVAPTGSIATISGLEGYGCEPVFALSYVRKTREGAEREGKEWREIFYESKLFDEALKKVGFNKAKRRKVFELVRENGGSCQKIKMVPQELREVFVVAGDLKVKEHVAMQAALQRFVDNSISKTINFSAEAKPEDVAEAYMLGWEMGLKGMTVYVDGSREMVVLEKAKKGPFEPKERKKVEKCPECGSTLVFKEGCATCPSCGYSRCDK